MRRDMALCGADSPHIENIESSPFFFALLSLFSSRAVASQMSKLGWWRSLRARFALDTGKKHSLLGPSIWGGLWLFSSREQRDMGGR